MSVGTSDNGGMARGWESKSVESQIEAAGERRKANAPPPPVERLELERKRDSMLLQRKRVSGQLDACRDPRYGKTLGDGLAFLDAQLAEIDHLLNNSIK